MLSTRVNLRDLRVSRSSCDSPPTVVTVGGFLRSLLVEEYSLWNLSFTHTGSFVAHFEPLSSRCLKVVHPYFMISWFQVDGARTLSQIVNSAILHNKCVVDPQSAAVVGYRIECICSIAWHLDIAIETEPIIGSLVPWGKREVLQETGLYRTHAIEIRYIGP